MIWLRVDASRSSPRTTSVDRLGGVVDHHGEVVGGHAVVALQHDVVDRAACATA